MERQRHYLSVSLSLSRPGDVRERFAVSHQCRVTTLSAHSICNRYFAQVLPLASTNLNLRFSDNFESEKQHTSSCHPATAFGAQKKVRRWHYTCFRWFDYIFWLRAASPSPSSLRFAAHTIHILSPPRKLSMKCRVQQLRTVWHGIVRCGVIAVPEMGVHVCGNETKVSYLGSRLSHGD